MKGESVAVFGQTCNAQLLKKTNTPTIALRFIRFVAANIGIDAELLAEWNEKCSVDVFSIILVEIYCFK